MTGKERFFIVFLILGTALAQTIHYEDHTIAANLTGGYQVVPADLNRDGKIDLIALASGLTELVWYENPGWQRHVIASNLPHMINCAPYDIDGDGIPEIAIAYEFSMDASKSIGIVGLLQHQGDPRNLWKLTEIDRLPTSHRLRWADIDGTGKKVLVNAPLSDAHAQAPDFRGHVPLVYYRPGEWKRITISDAEEGIVHGIYPIDWDHTGRDKLLIAGFLGIHLFKRGDNGTWSRDEITKGDPAPWPKSGSSDITVGYLGKERFIAAIEPWHGNQVAVYREKNGTWNRQVIDDSILDGHTILSSRGQIVAGYRGKPYGVNLYTFDGTKWNRQEIDRGGMSAAACATADLDGDGTPDLVCIGSATHNLKWYRLQK